METQFLNVDLEIVASENLQLIVEELGEKISVLYNGKNGLGLNFLVLETSESRMSETNPDEVINSFCQLIESLSAESKIILDKCISKKFDIGFESGDSLTTYQTEIKATTIERSAKLGLATTIYPQSE